MLRWGNVKVSESMITVEVRIDIRSSSPDSAAWSGSVVSPAGCCVQSFSLVDLRTLRWNPSGGDRLFLPVMQGIITDCAQFISTHDVTVCGAAHPELSGEGLERSEHPWVPNGGERTMGWLALLAAASAEGSHPAQALYIGAHDPEGRMKLLPAAASGSSALLRHVAIPDDLQDSVAGNWSTQYSTVLSIVNGSWYEAAQIYKTWALTHAAWTRAGSLQRRVSAGELPQWVLDVPLWARANMDCSSAESSDICNITSAGLCCAKKMLVLQKLLSAEGNVPRPSPPRPPGPPSPWNPCSAKLQSLCSTDRKDQVKCGQCAGLHAAVLKSVGCTEDGIEAWCRPTGGKTRSSCAKAMEGCWPVKGQGTACKVCETKQQRHLQAAGCNANDIAYYCAQPPAPAPPPLELGMHWYGWNAEQFDTRYPSYTARGGVAAETAFAQAHGIHVMPYTNGRLMDPTLPAWLAENASAHACGCFLPELVTSPPPTRKGMEGLVPCDATGKPGYYGEKYANNDQFMGTAAFAVMDPNSSYWQAKLASVAAGIVGNDGLGAAALYMDQISASHCESCFEGGRGGGGSGWSNGNRAVLAAVAAAGKRAHGGPIALSSESMNEQYLPRQNASAS